MAAKQCPNDSSAQTRRPPFTAVPLLASSAASASNTSLNSNTPLLTHRPTNFSTITESRTSGPSTNSFPYFPFSSLLPLKKLQKRKLSDQAQRGVLYSKDEPVEDDVKARGVIRICERELRIKQVKKDELGSLERYKKTVERRRREINPDDEEDGDEEEDDKKDDGEKEEAPLYSSFEWPRYRIF